MLLSNRITLIVSIILLTWFIYPSNSFAADKKTTWWSVQAIDTVKYSRDVAKNEASNPKFDNIIEAQIRDIADTGATHVAIGTPYDPEFRPFIKRWVALARKYKLKVWFRGNFSGWEQWFEYKPITREEHLRLLKEFISGNGDLFENGDIFTSCPECENGGPGDPRNETDVEGFRKFLIDEYKVSRDAFRLIAKNVTSNYFSMNGDVVKLVMDKETTKALGGVVVVDHYVTNPEKLSQDIKDLASSSGGKVVLGEFGAPIPDIQGEMSEDQQADWINRLLSELAKSDDLIGVNYWTSVGASTEIWNENRYAKKAVGVISKYFKPKTFKGEITNEAGGKIKGALFESRERKSYSDSKGQFSMPFIEKDESIVISADSYISQEYHAQEDAKTEITLVKSKPSLFFAFQKMLYRVFSVSF